MALELYLDLASQPCRSVYIFAKKNNIPFAFKNVSLMAGEQYGEEFGKLSIVRKVPVLQDGDFRLTESTAILLYLAEKFKTPDFWYPADLQQRTCINEYLSWQHLNTRMFGTKMFWFRLLIPKIMGVDVPKDKMDALLGDLNGTLNIIEEKFIQDRPFIAGNQISLADLVAIVEIMQPVASGLDVFKERPKLSAWRDRVQAAIGTELFDDAHQHIMGVEERLKQVDASKMQFFRDKCLKMLM